MLNPQPPKKAKKSFLIAIAVLFMGVTLVMVRRVGHTKPVEDHSAIATAARRADFVRSIRINGTVEAVNFLAIAAPRLSGPGLGTLVITKLAVSGTHVKKGELL